MKQLFLVLYYVFLLRTAGTQNLLETVLLNGNSIPATTETAVKKAFQDTRIQEIHQYAEAVQTAPAAKPRVSKTGAAPRNVIDADDDGMPDDWEILHGFNPANPADAFGDFDLDGVMNLFEFQLDTRPDDPAQPQAVNVSAAQDLEFLLTTAQDQTLFRLEGGVYPLNYLSFVPAHPRIVVQGGWNADFTARHICQNATVIDGQGLGEIFDVTVEEGHNAILLDGITFRNGSGLFGSIKFISMAPSGALERVKAYWSMLDCVVTQNQPTRTFGGAINFLHWDSSVVEVTLINTRITDNNTCGIYNQTVDDSYARWRLIHTSIAFNDDRDTPETDIGLGIRGFTLYSPARLDISMINSIVWGNDEYDLKFNNDGDSITIRADRSDIGKTNFSSITPGAMVFTAAPDCFNTNPLFTNPTEGILDLTPASPCLDTGLPLGILFSGAAPDIGANPCVQSVSGALETAWVGEMFSVWPNPATDFIEIKTIPGLGATTRASLYDAQGRLLRSAVFENRLRSELKDLPAGVYAVQVQSSDGRGRMEQFVKR